jgi:hypothetical protein
LLVFSICTVHYAINLPQCGANEGQMRELIGYLVACRGAEHAAARMAADIPQRFLRKQFLCEPFLCKGDRADHALIDDESISAGIAIGKAPSVLHTLTDNILTEGVRTGSPIRIVYSRENFTDDAREEVAGAIPDLGVLDRGSQAGQATGQGARRR